MTGSVRVRSEHVDWPASFVVGVRWDLPNTEYCAHLTVSWPSNRDQLRDTLTSDYTVCERCATRVMLATPRLAAIGHATEARAPDGPWWETPCDWSSIDPDVDGDVLIVHHSRDRCAAAREDLHGAPTGAVAPPAAP